MRVAIRQPDVGSSMTLRDAERYCAGMARREAKNFYWGFIALPRPKRMAIYALYDFARQVDDEADRAVTDRAPVNLTAHRERLQRCLAGDYADPVMRGLGAAIERYQIPAEELDQIIAGVAMDLERSRYASWEDLQQYCRLVASSVGRMCVRIFGYDDEEALLRADDLGQAMQLTNILRDIREDHAEYGRVYLPLDELARFELCEEAIVASLAGNGTGGSDPGPGWAPFVHEQAKRAWALFDSGVQVSRMIPKSSAACVLTMAGIYRDILRQIEQDPALPLTRRASLSSRSKLGVMARAWLRAA